MDMILVCSPLLLMCCSIREEQRVDQSTSWIVHLVSLLPMKEKPFQANIKALAMLWRKRWRYRISQVCHALISVCFQSNNNNEVFGGSGDSELEQPD